MKKSLGIIISAMAGTGKTTLAEKYSNVIDLESSYFKYLNQPKDKTEMEKAKGTADRILNQEYPENYIKAILEAQKRYDIICVRMNADMLIDFYHTYGIDFTFCIPTQEAYAEYQKRFKERGNSDEWIEKNKKYFLVATERFNQHVGDKILLDINENLEDALLKRKVRLIKRK